MEEANEADPYERAPSTGRVPIAKENIISAPVYGEPLDSAATCIDCVKPQGRKKVPAPIIIGANFVCSIFRKKERIFPGREIVF